MQVSGTTSGTAYFAGFICPAATVGSTLPCAWAPIGVNMLARNETICYDPWFLKDGLPEDEQVLADLNIAFIGQSGYGKSSLIKTMLERLLIPLEMLPDGSFRQRRAVVVDPKGEYEPLARALGAEPVICGHGVYLNPLDSRLDAFQHLQIAERFLVLLRGAELDPLEHECLRQGYDQAARLGRPLVLEDLRRELMRLDDGFVAETLHPADVVRQTGAKLGMELRRLITGPLRGMFDGPTSDAFDWHARIIDIVVHPDYRTSQRELVYQLLVSVIAVWMDQAWQNKDPRERVDVLVVDEAWEVV